MNTIIVINSEQMGVGDKTLGKKLIGAYLKKLWALEEKPSTILLYNSGVKLLTKESGVLDAMVGLAESGIRILACGTCLEYYQIDKDLLAGEVSNMEEIVDLMQMSDKVITI